MDKLDVGVSIVASLTVIVTLGFGVFTYVQQAQAAKRDVAMGLVASLNEGRLLEARRHLSTVLLDLDLSAFQGITVPRDTMATLMEQLVDTSPAPDELQQDIIAIVAFFDAAQACVASGRCDRATARENLAELGARYGCLLLPYADSLQDTFLLDGLGNGMRQFSDYETRC